MTDYERGYRRGVEDAARVVTERAGSWPSYTDTRIALESVARVIATLAPPATEGATKEEP